MCIFSAKASVSKTKINYLACGQKRCIMYSNSVELSSDDKGKTRPVAMILPVPGNSIDEITFPANQDSESFLDLTTKFFKDCNILQQQIENFGSRGGFFNSSNGMKSKGSLKQLQVGSFDVTLLSCIEDWDQVASKYKGRIALDKGAKNLLKTKYQGKGFVFLIYALQESKDIHPFVYIYNAHTQKAREMIPTTHYHGEEEEKEKNQPFLRPTFQNNDQVVFIKNQVKLSELVRDNENSKAKANLKAEIRSLLENLAPIFQGTSMSYFLTDCINYTFMAFNVKNSAPNEDIVLEEESYANILTHGKRMTESMNIYGEGKCVQCDWCYQSQLKSFIHLDKYDICEQCENLYQF